MPIKTLLKTSFLVFALVVVGVLSPGIAQGAELLMFEREGCVWCQRWDRTVGLVYDKAPEAEILPLRRVHIDRQAASKVTLATPVRYTPTFIAAENGREVGRITGYMNDESFWGLLRVLAAKIKSPPSESAPSPAPGVLVR